MKKSIQLKNSTDLMLLKQRLKYDVKFREEIIGSEIGRMNRNFGEALKNTARMYTKKLTIMLLLKMIRSRFK